jgi:hypothetical protein
MQGGTLFRYGQMLKHWTAMATGRSYWHQEQGVGRQFHPGQLRGYFNDLTAKAEWPGETDASGVPLCKCAGAYVHWPVTVAQKGLAHWDLWLESGRTAQAHWIAFHEIAQWLLRAQDDRGGWVHPVPFHPRALSRFSCMSQGEGVSILVRAFSQTGEEQYLQAARRALEVMLEPVENGGTAVYLTNQVVLEEYPSPDRAPVLNGWIFAIFGLYDYELATSDEEMSQALRITTRTLADWLPRFDCRFWSRYDSAGMIASPFYHRLHIAQLDVLAQVFPEHIEFSQWRNHFSEQLRSTFKTGYAVSRKIVQKLTHPPRVILGT